MIRGIHLAEGRAALAALAEEVWWRGGSPMLCSACAVTLPGFRFQPTGGRAQDMPGDDRRGSRVGLSFVRDPATETWAEAHGIRLLMPSLELASQLSDKLVLETLATEAGVRVPASIVVRQASPRQTHRLWGDAGERPLVAQIGSDGKNGTGTRPVRSAPELAAVLGRWRGRDLKLSELLEGLPITASGCIGADRTVVSGFSHQLVGFPRLTAHWATHCGNQLLGAGDADPRLIEEAGESCRRLGETLRRHGFRGMFGIDAIAAPDGVAVIEINARIQSVSSLVGEAEAEHGLLPSQATHLLAHELDELPPDQGAGPPRRPLSQVVVYAETAVRMESDLPAGVYQLDDAGGLLLASPEPCLRDAGEEDAVVWPFAAAGDEIVPGTKLAVIQFPRHAAPVDPARNLLPAAERWVRALRHGLGDRSPAGTKTA